MKRPGSRSPTFRQALCVVTTLGIAVLAAACSEDASLPLGPNSKTELAAVVDRQQSPPSRFALAQFEHTDESGCLSTDVSIAALVTSEEKLTSVFIEQFDFCTFESFFAASDDVVPTLFEVSGDLGSAHLQTTIPAFSDHGSVQVQVDLTWTGSGARQTLTTGDVFVDPENPSGCKIVSNDARTLRQATASGTVSIANVNYTPEPSTGGVLARSNTSQIAIQCS